MSFHGVLQYVDAFASIVMKYFIVKYLRVVLMLATLILARRTLAGTLTIGRIDIRTFVLPLLVKNVIC